MPLPKVAITIGDPAGIGPEIVDKIISSRKLYKISRPVVIGDVNFLPKNTGYYKRFPVSFEDVKVPSPSGLVPGRPSRFSGKSSYEYLLRALELIADKKADCLVTAPISKTALTLAGVPFCGHTELLASLTCTSKYAMIMLAGHLRVSMVTRHIPISSVSCDLSFNKIIDTVKVSHKFLKENLKIKNPRIAVCALNPHAGEDSLCGKEEKVLISPAVKSLRESGLLVEGPLPSDSAWLKMKQKKYDLIVAMYHDQAMIGLKCAFHKKIVNVTAGLPFVRTSPGHGTAYDIAGKCLADPASMFEAIRLAASLSK